MKHLVIILVLTWLTTCFSTPGIIQEIEKIEEVPIVESSDEATFTEEEVAIFIPHETLPVTAFPEVWAYVVAGHESAYRRGLPITDIAYFGAEVDIYGTLSKVPNRQNLASFPGRVHLAVTCFNYALTYFALLPGSPQRNALINDLISATRNFDGLNIDFENIPARSADAFLSFLQELREGLPDKMLTIALYARVRTLNNDIYDYARIAPLVDRIFVMAYDQHWGGGPAGPVSTLSWCRSVADYSLRVAGSEKIIMGIPFYGRAWANQNHHRALIFTTTERLINTYNATVRRENGTPTFEYNPTINVRVYYEDEFSISARLQMYKSIGVRAVGFWRLGQETPRVWQVLKLE
jgi:hypothetical protein